MPNPYTLNPKSRKGHVVNEAVMLRGVDPRCHAEASLDLDGKGYKAQGLGFRV
jgi:hypothetical protein